MAASPKKAFHPSLELIIIPKRERCIDQSIEVAAIIVRSTRLHEKALLKNVSKGIVDLKNKDY
jgi:hypothetical protein